MGGSGSKIKVEEKKVVVVGGGIAGVEVAKKLATKGVRVTLISKDDYIVILPMILKAYVDSSVPQKGIRPLSSIFNGKKYASVDVIQGLVVEVETEKKQTILADGKTVEYDILIIATGCAFNFPNAVSLNFDEAPTSGNHQNTAISTFKSVYESVKRAKTVAVIGGGPVGLETAGEIAGAYPEISVHLFHSGSAVLDNLKVSLKPKTIRKLESQLNGMVNVHCNTRVDLKSVHSTIADEDRKNMPKSILDRVGQNNPFALKTDKGETIDADMVFVCVGHLPIEDRPSLWNSDFFQSNASKEHPGRLQIDSNMRVKGARNIFALGDCAYLEENQMAYYAAKMHTPVVVKNVVDVIQGKEPSKTYSAQTKAAMIIPLGPKKGVTEMEGKVFGAFMTQKFAGMKSS